MSINSNGKVSWGIFALMSLIFLIFLISLFFSRDPVGARGLGKPVFSENLQYFQIENGEVVLNSTVIKLPHGLCDTNNLRNALRKAKGHLVVVTENALGTVIVEFANQPLWNCRP